MTVNESDMRSWRFRSSWGEFSAREIDKPDYGIRNWAIRTGVQLYWLHNLSGSQVDTVLCDNQLWWTLTVIATSGRWGQGMYIINSIKRYFRLCDVTGQTSTSRWDSCEFVIFFFCPQVYLLNMVWLRPQGGTDNRGRYALSLHCLLDVHFTKHDLLSFNCLLPRIHCYSCLWILFAVFNDLRVVYRLLVSQSVTG